MKANDIKKWFAKQFNIAVRVRTVNVKHPFAQVWIPANPTTGTEPLTYPTRFPDDLGNKLMQLTYPNEPTLCAQNWGGNTQPHSLSFNAQQWNALIAQYPS